MDLTVPIHKGSKKPEKFLDSYILIVLLLCFLKVFEKLLLTVIETNVL